MLTVTSAVAVSSLSIGYAIGGGNSDTPDITPVATAGSAGYECKDLESTYVESGTSGLAEQQLLAHRYLGSNALAEYVQSNVARLDSMGVGYTQVLSESDLPPTAGHEYALAPVDPVFAGVSSRDAVLGASYYPTALLQALQAHLYIVDSIDTRPDDHTRGNFAGIHISYDTDQVEDDILVVDSAETAVYIHELAHALQKELCNESSRFRMVVDQLQSEGTQIQYLEDDNLTVVGGLTELSETRQFADSHGAQNFREDWASLLTDTLFNRGAVLPGDPDYGSPYQRKQSAMLEDIEARFPGFGQYLRGLTGLYRALPSSPLNQYLAAESGTQTWYTQAEYLAPEVLGSDMVIEKIVSGSCPLSYINGLVVVVNYSDEPFIDGMLSSFIQDPIVGVAENGQVYIGYYGPRYFSEEPQLEFMYYDPRHMVVLHSNDTARRTTSEGQILLTNQQLTISGIPFATKQSTIDYKQTAEDTSEMGDNLDILPPDQFVVLATND